MKIPARYVRIDGELTREARQILAALTCPTFDVGTALTLFAQGWETLDEIDLRLWAELDDAATLPTRRDDNTTRTTYAQMRHA